MSALFNDFYRGKRVLLTGHTGFKGSWLSVWLNRLGAEVTGYSLPAIDPGMFRALQLQNELKHHESDVRDLRSLQKVIDDCKPNVILHLAAQPLVRLSYSEPLMTYETNVMGTANILQAARSCDELQAVVNVTTDKCYDNREEDYAYIESDPMGGYDPYSSSKGCSELVTAAFRSSFFRDDHAPGVASARAGNVIGGGDWCEDRLLPDCFRFLATGRDIVLRNPDAIRPWQFVLEPLAGYLQLAAMLASDISLAEGWNFGPHPEERYSVGEVTRKVVELWGSGHVRVEQDGSKHEAHLLQLSIDKAMQRLHWRPVYSLQQALSATVEWYKAFNQSADMAAITNKQLEAFIAEATAQNLPWTIDD